MCRLLLISVFANVPLLQLSLTNEPLLSHLLNYKVDPTLWQVHFMGAYQITAQRLLNWQ